MSLRIGIVGAGANTRLRHIPGFQRLAGVEVVAVCNRTRASAEKVASEFRIGKVYDDWKELVHSSAVDAVCIGTWPYLHCPITLEALAAGKHVLTEARMAADLSEARRMHEAANRSDRVAMVVPAPLFLGPEAVVLEMVAGGFFGDFLEIHIRGLGGAHDPEAPIHWRQRRDLSGLNVMALGILDETVRRYAGDERAVLAHGRIFTRQRLDAETGARRTVDVPESLGVLVEMHSGATAVYHLSSVARLGGGPSLEVHGTRGAFRLEGEEAWVAGPGQAQFRRLEIPPERQGGWQVEEDFAAAVLQGRPVTRTSFADGVKYMVFTEAVDRSLQQGRRVELPLDAVTD